MKKYVFLSFLFLLSARVSGQNKKAQDWKPVHYKGQSYLCGGQVSGGEISKARFDSLIAYPLIAKDSLNTEHTVFSFFLTYAERGLFEDSTGHPTIMTNYTGTNSENGKLPDYWLKSLRERSKAGDTVMISNIIYFSGPGKPVLMHSKPIKLILTQ
jgi:hypothetical protein